MGAPLETATFIDPTAAITGTRQIGLAEQIYIGPFAELSAGNGNDSDGAVGITVGPQSNIQDNVSIVASVARDADAAVRLAALGLTEASGVEIAERVILAHGASVRGPAQIGIGGGDIAANPDGEQEVFLSFGSQVDGAILERNTGLAALSRVGPGIRLRSGFITQPGKNIVDQADADDPGRGKVRLITEADVTFNEAVIQVNLAFAREYTRLYREDATSVRGINFDPGNAPFNPNRDLPRLAGLPTRDPSFRNRIIGDLSLADSRRRINTLLGSRISLRADEGEPIALGRIRRMHDGVIFHSLQGSSAIVGNNVTYGAKSIVHGGDRPQSDPEAPAEPTVIEDDVTLGEEAIVFRSLIGQGSTIGARSLVVNSQLAPNTVIPARTVFADDAVFGPVEW